MDRAIEEGEELQKTVLQEMGVALEEILTTDADKTEFIQDKLELMINEGDSKIEEFGDPDLADGVLWDGFISFSVEEKDVHLSFNYADKGVVLGLEEPDNTNLLTEVEHFLRERGFEQEGSNDEMQEGTFVCKDLHSTRILHAWFPSTRSAAEAADEIFRGVFGVPEEYTVQVEKYAPLLHPSEDVR